MVGAAAALTTISYYTISVQAAMCRLHPYAAGSAAEPGGHGKRPAPGCVTHVRGQPQDRRWSGSGGVGRLVRRAVGGGRGTDGRGFVLVGRRRGLGRGAVAQCGCGRGRRREQS